MVHEINVGVYKLEPSRISAGTSGSYGVEKIRFIFGDEWSGLLKTVTFYPKMGKPVSVLLTADEIDIPHEATAKTGEVKFAVEGSSSGKVIRSLPGQMSVMETVKGSGAPGQTPTPTETEQIKDYAEAAISTLEQVKKDIEAGMVKGDKGDKGDTGAKGDKGDTGAQGVSGVYVGSGDMPAGYNVQIDPDGDYPLYAPVVKTDAMTQIVGVDNKGQLWSSPAADASDKFMPKTSPTGTGSFSLNRKADTEIGEYSTAEGLDNAATAKCAHAEGSNNTANGRYSHVEGWGNTTGEDANNAHVEGVSSQATAPNSHAEGNYSKASGQNAHAEGSGCTASGQNAHAEGNNSLATGESSHAEGYACEANGGKSHAEGGVSIASGDYQHVQGKHNVIDTAGTYAHIVGNGTADNKKNIHTVDWSGNAWFEGDVYVGSTGGKNKDAGSKKLASEEFVTDAIDEIPDYAPEIAKKISYEEQTLTDEQKTQARANIGAGSAADAAKAQTSVQYDTTQSLTMTQQKRARSNIAAKSNNLGLLLLSNLNTAGSEQTASFDADVYRSLYVEARPATNSALLATIIPTFALQPTAQTFQVADEANYVTFDLALSGYASTVTLTASLNSKKTTGVVTRIIAIP